MALCSQSSSSNLLEMGADGAIIVDPEVNDSTHELFSREGITVVTVGRVLGVSSEENTYWVDTDQHETTGELLEHLTKKGAKRIAVISAPLGPSYVQDSLEAYTQWCQKIGQEPLLRTLGGVNFEKETREATAALIEQDDPPDAIFCHLQPVGIEVLRLTLEKGLRVPDDMMLATMSDATGVNELEGLPSITGCNLNPDELGVRAVQLLNTVLDGEDPVSPNVLVPTEVIPRQSTNRK